MYNSHISQIPASWASLPSNTSNGNGTHDGHTNGFGNGNGHSNGNGHATREVPESFLHGKFVRTVYGLVPLRLALDWPIFASYDELERCASWMGGRIPTFEEAKSIYAYVNKQKRAEAERTLGKTVPAVNG